nr:unnamed protein product [Digitaria exilis]
MRRQAGSNIVGGVAAAMSRGRVDDTAPVDDLWSLCGLRRLDGSLSPCDPCAWRARTRGRDLRTAEGGDAR